MELPAILQPVVHYFFARPPRMFVLAGIGIVATVIFHLWLRRPNPRMSHPTLLVLVSSIVAAPLLLFSVLSLLWSVFCFLGGPDGQFGSRASIVAGCVFVVVASIGLLVGLWNLRVGLRTRCR
jgi:hypothetical protein